MKTRIFAILAVFTFSITLANIASAQCTCGCGSGSSCGGGCSCGQSAPLASQVINTVNIPARYPLTTCVVSGKPINTSRPHIVYIYRRAGQPARTVVLYDTKSLAAFKKAPDKYLAILYAATAQQQIQHVADRLMAANAHFSSP